MRDAMRAFGRERGRLSKWITSPHIRDLVFLNYGHGPVRAIDTVTPPVRCCNSYNRAL